jgi:alkylhydroperoxidase family enzyme
LGDERLVSAVLADLETAPINEAFRATLRLLSKLTLQPEQIHAEDIEAVRVEGVTDRAIEDAIHVCALFNIVDRCADALGFEFPANYDRMQYGRGLLKMGYGWIVGVHDS